jgi:KamA family protein
MTTPKYINDINKISELSDEKKEKLKKVTNEYMFRANSYYLGLINWDDPKDPIKRIIIPSEDELDNWGDLDASSESKYTVAKGLEHKYTDTALFLVSKVCGSICRFCFRKRLFKKYYSSEILTRKDYEPAFDYIRKHDEITNVLLTGGDSLIIATDMLEWILSELRKIEHVKIIRLGSKMVVFNPFRIINDEKLLQIINKYSTTEKKIYVMAHINSHKEITPESSKAIEMLKEAGAELCNQTPLIAGVNDSVDTLVKLFQKLSFMGVPPYYVFQCRPTKGNYTFSVPIEKGYKLFSEAISKVSGLAKRARFVMSHATGKIEIVGLNEENIFMRYHRAANPEDYKKFLIFDRNPEARWLDDYLVEAKT